GLKFSNNSNDTEFLNQFPFHTEESVIACEKLLQTDNDIKENFKHFLHSIGGVDAKSHIRRILNKLFSNKFAINCSWTGRAFEKNISKYKIQNLQIIAVMKCV
ncbi:Integrase catalytic domain-containing protein, partial [Aphis craccivora]